MEDDRHDERVCVLLEISGEGIGSLDVASVAGIAALRSYVLRAVVDPGVRVVAVIPVPVAQALMEMYDDVATMIGSPPKRPPKGYIPPVSE